MYKLKKSNISKHTLVLQNHFIIDVHSLSIMIKKIAFQAVQIIFFLIMNVKI